MNTATTQALARLICDPDHRYWLDGDAVPGVTRVLSSVRLIDYTGVRPEVLARAAAIGRAVHQAAWYADDDDLDRDTLDPVVRPYLDAWARFRLETGFEPKEKERRVYSHAHHFAGTFDRLGVCRRGATGSEPPLVLLDLKTTSTLQPGVGPQLAAYAQAVRESGLGDVGQRLAVHLRRDGTYRAQTYRDPNDWQVFRAALSIYQWKEAQP